MIHNINSLKDIFEDYFDNILIILSQCDFKKVENILEAHKIIEKKLSSIKLFVVLKIWMKQWYAIYMKKF